MLDSCLLILLLKYLKIISGLENKRKTVKMRSLSEFLVESDILKISNTFRNDVVPVDCGYDVFSLSQGHRVAEAASWVWQGWGKLAFPRVFSTEEVDVLFPWTHHCSIFPLGGDKWDWI